jgi:hypothetical protein
MKLLSLKMHDVQDCSNRTHLCGSELEFRLGGHVCLLYASMSVCIYVFTLFISVHICVYVCMYVCEHA